MQNSYECFVNIEILKYIKRNFWFNIVLICIDYYNFIISMVKEIISSKYLKH